MRIEHIACDVCEYERRAQEAENFLRLNVQMVGRKFWLDLCSRECAAEWFRSSSLKAAEGYQEEGQE